MAHATFNRLVEAGILPQSLVPTALNSWERAPTETLCDVIDTIINCVLREIQDPSTLHAFDDPRVPLLTTTIKDLQGHIARLEEQLARANGSGPEVTEPTQKGGFVI